MALGGARAGAGRKKGGHNKLAEEAIQSAKATGIMPLDYLLQVMRDAGSDEARRIDAAKAAAPYVHARLQPKDDAGSTAQTIIVKGKLEWQAPQ